MHLLLLLGMDLLSVICDIMITLASFIAINTMKQLERTKKQWHDDPLPIIISFDVMAFGEL